MEDQMIRPLDADAPMFRCIYLPNALHAPTGSERNNTFAFVFCTNHCIIDGMSTIFTLRRFRLFLDEICSGKEPNIESWPKMHPPADYYIGRAIEKLPKERRQALESAVNLRDLLNPKSCVFVEKRGVESSKDPKIPYRTCLTIKEFSSEQVQKLRLACRVSNTTIQAAAQTAGAIALAKLLQDCDEWETMKINYNLAANMRPRVANMYQWTTPDFMRHCYPVSRPRWVKKSMTRNE